MLSLVILSAMVGPMTKSILKLSITTNKINAHHNDNQHNVQGVVMLCVPKNPFMFNVVMQSVVLVSVVAPWRPLIGLHAHLTAFTRT
jgi:hypothetical protein